MRFSTQSQNIYLTVGMKFPSSKNKVHRTMGTQKPNVTSFFFTLPARRNTKTHPVHTVGWAERAGARVIYPRAARAAAWALSGSLFFSGQCACIKTKGCRINKEKCARRARACALQEESLALSQVPRVRCAASHTKAVAIWLAGLFIVDGIT